jgi:hypothetical protein
VDEIWTVFAWNCGGIEKTPDDVHARDYTLGAFFLTDIFVADFCKKNNAPDNVYGAF